MSAGSRPRPSPLRPSSNTSHSPDALELLLLLRDHDPARYTRAALRWHARFCREVPGVPLNEAVAVLALLAALAGEPKRTAARALAELFRERDLDEPARIIIRWVDGGRPV